MYSVKSTEKPKWHEFRWKLSNFFIWCARKTYKKNPEVYAFYCEQIMDQAIYGRSVVRIDPGEMEK